MNPVPARVVELLDLLGDKVATDKREDIIDWADHNEPGLAVDVLADTLYENDVSLTPVQKAILRDIIEAMGLSVRDYAYVGLA